MTNTLYEGQNTFLIISRSVLLRIRYVSDKSCRGSQHTYFMLNNCFFENRAVYEKKWKKYCTAVQATDDNMVHAHCMLDT